MNSNITLKVKLNNENASVLTFGSKYAAGMDLYSCEDIIIPPQKTKAIDTNFATPTHELKHINNILKICHN